MSTNQIHSKEDIYFRDIEEKDIESLRVMHNDTSTLFMLTDTTVVTPEMQQKWFQSLKNSNKSKRYSLCITQKGKEILIGMIRFDQIDEINQNMLVGLDIMPYMRGQGLGKKGFKLILDYCFDKKKMHKVTLYTAAYNSIAINMYKGLGFHIEGTLKEHLFRDNKYHDLIVMSLFRREFSKNEN